MSTQRPVVRGGTREKLVERLTYEKYPDPDYMADFLLTYKSFMTPNELLELLRERYNVPMPRDCDTKPKVDEWVKNQREPIRLRILLARDVRDRALRKSADEVARQVVQQLQLRIPNLVPSADLAGQQLAVRLDRDRRIAGLQRFLQGVDQGQVLRDVVRRFADVVRELPEHPAAVLEGHPHAGRTWIAMARPVDMHLTTSNGHRRGRGCGCSFHRSPASP